MSELHFKICLNLLRNKNVPVNHRDFWYATYTLYSVSEKTKNEEKMNDNASASSGSDQGPSSRQHTMVSFLKPVLKQIIMAGKSMQLLKNLRCAESTASQVAARGSPSLPHRPPVHCSPITPVTLRVLLFRSLKITGAFYFNGIHTMIEWIIMVLLIEKLIVLIGNF